MSAITTRAPEERAIGAGGRPVLFLDVDGVLNCKATFLARPRGKHVLCRDRICILNQVVAETGCWIVMSSSWRGLNSLRGLLRDYGLRARFARDWRTPFFWSDHPLHGPRGNEIADWLQRNGAPPYAIVDDDGDMLPEQMSRFVQTTFDAGLTDERAARLVAILSAARPDHAPAADPRGRADGDTPTPTPITRNTPAPPRQDNPTVPQSAARPATEGVRTPDTTPPERSGALDHGGR